MDIIEKLQLYWKVRFGRPTWYEFKFLLVEAELSGTENRRFAKNMLKIYAAHHTFTEEEIYALAEKHISFLDMMSAYARHKYVLSEAFIRQLIDRKEFVKLGNIVRFMPLSVVGEKMLIDAAKSAEKFEPEKQGTIGCALANYLVTNPSSKVFADPSVQKELAFNKKALHLFIKRCTIRHCYLHDEMISLLIQEKDEDALRHLLAVSYIANESLQKSLVARYPSLSDALKISVSRRRVFEFDTRYHQNLGGADMYTDELALELHTTDPSEWSREERQRFIEEDLQPFMDAPYSTPSFLAWVAYNFPELSAQAADKLEIISERMQEAEQ